ncbi:MAG: T9SS type A sorting domain-containing protein, partial [Ignavibacterium sp.]|nr:T9SS type A sorting domain-containing protein [Ignavibacterium sp.]
NPTTTIRYDLPKDGLVQLEVFDILGRKMATLVNTRQSAGRYDINFDARNLASGIYI